MFPIVDNHRNSCSSFYNRKYPIMYMVYPVIIILNFDSPMNYRLLYDRKMKALVDFQEKENPGFLTNQNSFFLFQ